MKTARMIMIQTTRILEIKELLDAMNVAYVMARVLNMGILQLAAELSLMSVVVAIREFALVMTTVYLLKMKQGAS